MIDILKSIISKKVQKLFLIIWPPIGENDVSQIDMSIGIVFEDKPEELLKISTDKDDLTSPLIEPLNIPDKAFKWDDFDHRMNAWMNDTEEMEIDNEYYDVSDVDCFKQIVNQKVLDVELVKFTEGSILGLKLIFRDDFILSTPISDGNTVETTRFNNNNNNLKNFTIFGDIEYISLKTLTT